MINSTQKRLASLGWWLHAGGLLLTAAIFAIALIAYQSFDRDRDRLDRQISAMSRFLNTGDEIHFDHRDLNQRLSVMEGRLTDLMTRIPAARNESDFLAQLTELAHQYKLKIQNYRPGVVFEKEKYSEMEIKLSAEGSYQSCCRFLAGLESLPRLCRITHLNISAPDDAEIYPIEMTLRIYFAPLQQTTSQELRNKHG